MTPSTQRESDADWPTDPRVKLVYELLCDTSEPPGDLHWEGWLAERIVAALENIRDNSNGWQRDAAHGALINKETGNG